NARAAELNARLEQAGVPVRVANLSTIWTVGYTQPSRYHWMLQYYLRAQGLALSWVGTGRFIFTLGFDDRAYAEVADRFVAATRQMQAEGWWWRAEGLTGRAIGLQMLREMLAHRFR
ncbi:MAG: glutamate-1-semialdehyde 2,1-aminomutase, partial [Rubrivivax sp.]